LLEKKRNILLLLLLLVASRAGYAAERSHHPHHVAAATGYSWHGNEESVYAGVDYVYSFQNGFTVGAFIEDVRGDFDLQAVGVLFGKKWSNGFSLSAGPGVEYKIKKDKHLFLVRATAAYNWHFSNWSIGPIFSYDAIEDASNATYLGIAVGYGF
jgi:hypothetical protein